jgi:Yip1 domain
VVGGPPGDRIPGLGVRRGGLLADVAEMAVRPWRRLPRLVEGRPLWLATGLVLAVGVACLAISLAAVATEPATGQERAADIGFSAALPPLFLGVWLLDALVVDAVAQLMGRPSRRRRYLEVSAYTLPVLAVCELVRLVQAAIDRAAGAGGDAAATAVGFLYLAVLAWFVVVVTATIRAVYDLPAASALAAALSPPAVVATLLLALLVVATALHLLGVG